MYSLLVSPPADEPITLVDAKAHLRVTHSAEDDLIASYISAARQAVEEDTRRALVTQSWQTVLDGFPCGRIILARPPLISIVSVTYTDPDGAEQALADFWPDLNPVAPSIRPVHGAGWPAARNYPGSVVVATTNGYGSPTAVPAALKTAIRFLVGHFFVNREAVVTGPIATKMPIAVESLLAPFRVRTVP